MKTKLDRQNRTPFWKQFPTQKTFQLSLLEKFFFHFFVLMNFEKKRAPRKNTHKSWTRMKFVLKSVSYQLWNGHSQLFFKNKSKKSKMTILMREFQLCHPWTQIWLQQSTPHSKEWCFRSFVPRLASLLTDVPFLLHWFFLKVGWIEITIEGGRGLCLTLIKPRHECSKF